MSVARVMILPNGMVAVFDERGRQIPALQGPWEEKRFSIACAASDLSSVEEVPGGEWRAERVTKWRREQKDEE